MTTKQREAIEYLKDMKNNQKDLNKSGYVYVNEKIDTVLSLIKQLETEKEIHIGLEHQYKKEYLDMSELNQKLKKQIDLMAFNLADYVMYYEYAKCRNPEMIKNKAEEIKQYFERKVEDEK